MSKYDVRFCKCGTIHFLEMKTLDDWCTDGKHSTGKEIVHVCLNCGASIIRGLEDYEDGFAFYSRDVQETIVGFDSNKYLVILSKGVKLYMKSGNRPTGNRGNCFIDEEALLREIGTSNLHEIKEINHAGEGKYNLRNIDSLNVNMDLLLRDLTPEQAKSISGFYIKSFNWANTPYATTCNQW